MRDITLEDTFYQTFTTRAFATGIPTVLAGTPVVSAYENASLTQITAGITLGVDHDSVVGLNMLTVVATAANGYEAGKDYALVITTGTVGGVSVVGEVVAEFSIGRSAAAVDLANGTDGLGAIKAETALIVADTGELQTDWADGGRLDLIQDIIAADTTTDIPALIATAQADLDIITDTDGVIVGAAGVDLLWDEVLTGITHNEPNSAGRRLRQIDAAFEVHEGTAQAGAAGTITLDAGASSVDDIYRGDRIIITEGTGAQEHGLCTSYNGTTKVATMAENWVVTPDATSVFEVVPADCDVETWQHNIVTASASGLPDVNVNEVGDTAQTAGDLAALTTTVDTVVDAIKVKTDSLTFTIAGEVDANTITIGTGVIDTTALATDAVDEIADGVKARPMAEGYATDGTTTVTVEQMLYMIYSVVAQSVVSGTAINCKKIDGITNSMVFTTNSATDPTERIRTT
jgi:hypothetical protein